MDERAAGYAWGSGKRRMRNAGEGDYHQDAQRQVERDGQRPGVHQGHRVGDSLRSVADGCARESFSRVRGKVVPKATEGGGRLPDVCVWRPPPPRYAWSPSPASGRGPPTAASRSDGMAPGKTNSTTPAARVATVLMRMRVRRTAAQGSREMAGSVSGRESTSYVRVLFQNLSIAHIVPLTNHFRRPLELILDITSTGT